MPVVGVRQLSRETKEVIDSVVASGEPIVVTREGKPLVVLSRVADEQLPALALAVVPGLVERRREAAEQVEKRQGRPFSEWLAERHEGDDTSMPVSLARLVPDIDEPFIRGLAAASTAAAGIPAVMEQNPDFQRLVVQLTRNFLANLVPDITSRVASVTEHVIASVGSENNEAFLEGLMEATRVQRQALEAQTPVERPR